MKLSSKIGNGFGAVIVIAGVLGYFGWHGVSRMQDYMTVFATWGNIDMVMNEGVIQRYQHCQYVTRKFQASKSQADFKEAENSFAHLEEGLTEWTGLVQDHPELSKAAQTVQANVKETRQLLTAYRDSVNQQAEIYRKWDSVVTACLDHLFTTMEDVIDPAKGETENAKDIEGMVKWGAIDMIMNEGVIANVLKLQTASHDYAAEGTPQAWEEFQTAITAANEGLDEWRQTLAGESKMEKAANQVQKYLEEYASLAQQYYESRQDAHAAEQSMNRAGEALYTRLNDVMETVIDPAKETALAEADSAQQKTSATAMGLAFGAIILGVFLSVVITRSIAGPIKTTIASLDQNAEQVSEASSQVASSSQELAQALGLGNGAQSSSFDETCNNLEQMASMTRTNVENSSQANSLSQKAKEAAQSGDQTMYRMDQAMTAINESSGEIRQIIKVIEEIAFQTNLLALNAAVEAARAGEHGKGFAVVADEVRNLAQRATEAARKTTGLIEESVSRAQEGTNVAEEARGSFEAILADVNSVADLIEGITSSNEKQVLIADQVSSAVIQINELTQRNASGAEESAAVAEELNASSFTMKENIRSLSRMIGNTE